MRKSVLALCAVALVLLVSAWYTRYPSGQVRSCATSRPLGTKLCRSRGDGWKICTWSPWLTTIRTVMLTPPPFLHQAYHGGS
jgi:hypothetical protein